MPDPMHYEFMSVPFSLTRDYGSSLNPSLFPLLPVHLINLINRETTRTRMIRKIAAIINQ